MTPTEIREAVARLVEEIDGYAETRDSSAQTCIGFAAEDCRPALSALAGCCVLDVEVVRALLGMATVESGDDCIAREAAEAELRRVES